MSFWKRLFKSSSFAQHPTVKRSIKYNNLTIKLYEVDWYKSFVTPNIKAFNSNGELQWVVETPTLSFHYWDMQIDEENNILDVDDGSSYHYQISLIDGHIISGRLIK